MITRNPREENCMHFVRATMLPDYKLLSLTTFLCLAYLAVFIAGCIIGFKTDG